MCSLGHVTLYRQKDISSQSAHKPAPAALHSTCTGSAGPTSSQGFYPEQPVSLADTIHAGTLSGNVDMNIKLPHSARLTVTFALRREAVIGGLDSDASSVVVCYRLLKTMKRKVDGVDTLNFGRVDH